VIEYIAKLRRCASGGLRAEQRKTGRDVDKERQKWWEGYLQALDDVEEHAAKAVGI